MNSEDLCNIGGQFYQRLMFSRSLIKYPTHSSPMIGEAPYGGGYAPFLYIYVYIFKILPALYLLCLMLYTLSLEELHAP